MAYNASYEEGDIAESVISTIVKMLVTLASLVTVIVVIMLYTWFRKRL